MKKSNLWAGLAFTALGIFLLLMVLAGPWESSLVCGLGGGSLGSGLVTVGKYVYWTSPKRVKTYQERLEEERILLQDELLARLRDRAGRIAYLLGLGVTSLAIAALGILKELGIAGEIRGMVIYLFLYLLFQLIAGAVIFRMLKKRY